MAQNGAGTVAANQDTTTATVESSSAAGHDVAATEHTDPTGHIEDRQAGMAAVNPNDSRIYTRSVDLETIVEQRLLDIFGAAYRVHQTTQHGRSLSRLMRRARAGCGVKATATHRRLMPGVEHRQSKYLE